MSDDVIVMFPGSEPEESMPLADAEREARRRSQRLWKDALQKELRRATTFDQLKNVISFMIEDLPND